MFTLNLGWARSGEPSTFERLHWAVPPAPALEFRAPKPRTTVPETEKRSGWFSRFEAMITQYADLVVAQMRD